MKRPEWTTIAIIIGLPILLAFDAWLISIMSHPAQWCGIAVGAAKETGARFAISDCTQAVHDLIHWLGWIAVGHVIVIGIAFLSIVMRDLKMNLDAGGPGGSHLKLGADNQPAATVTTTTAVTTPAPKGPGQ